MEKKYDEILSKGKLNINPNKYFVHLTEEEETLITRELINYMFWFYANMDFMTEYLKKKNIKVKNSSGFFNTQNIVEFWLQEIGKSSELERLLNNTRTLNDIYDYVDRYFTRFSYVFINTERDFGMVLQKDFRTEEQYQKLLEILKIENMKTKKIKEFLNKNKMDINHISKKNADLLINLGK